MKAPPGSFVGLDERYGYSRLWARGIRGQGVTIAVLDTGVDPVDDLSQYLVVARDFTGDDDPSDRSENGHGTSIARNIHLTAPDARIASLKVLPSRRGGRRAYVIEALRYSIRDLPRPSVATLALSFPTARGFWWRHEPERCRLCNVINEAVEAGILVIVAAGNEGPRPGTVTCPATAERAWSVGAIFTREQSEWWDGLPRFRLWWLKQSGWLGKHFGSSFSAAYVAGGVALALSAYPNLTRTELKQHSTKVGRRLAGLRPWEDIRQINWEEFLVSLMGEQEFEQRFRWPYGIPMTFMQALDNVHQVAGDRYSQRDDNRPLIDSLRMTLDTIEVLAETKLRSMDLARTIEQILSWLVPGCLPEYEQRLRRLASLCRGTDFAQEQRVVEALRFARAHPSTAGHAKVLEELKQLDPRLVSSVHRMQVWTYLSSLHDTIRAVGGDAQEFLCSIGLAELERRWNPRTSKEQE